MPAIAALSCPHCGRPLASSPLGRFLASHRALLLIALGALVGRLLGALLRPVLS